MRDLLNFLILIQILLVIINCSEQPRDQIKAQARDRNPWSHLNVNADPDHFQFAIVADRTGGSRIGVFEDAIRRLNLLQPELVMSVGDLIEGYTDDAARLHREWDEFEALIDDLEMPFFYVPGNHDITDDLSLRTWQERHGDPYYSFVYKDVLFLCLNSQDVSEGHDEPYIASMQREWVRRTLQEHPTVRWTLVFLHKPLWAYPPEEFADEESEDEENDFVSRQGTSGWPEVEAELKGRGHTVFAGHFHHYHHFERNESDYIILSTTGGHNLMRGPLHGQFDHLVWVTMKDDGPRIVNLLLEGIWDKQMSADSYTAVLRSRLIKHELYDYREGEEGELYLGNKATLSLSNDEDIPMQLELLLNPANSIRIEPSHYQVTIPPNSVELLDIEFIAEKKLYYDEDLGESVYENLIDIHWEATFEDTEQGRLVAEGFHRIELD